MEATLEPTANESKSPHGRVVLGFTFILAFCSIVYELLLGQTLAAFLGNTVLRYSVTVGLYMLSMGIGAFLASRRILARSVVSLQKVEILLTVLGAASVMGLLVLERLGIPALVFSGVAHGLIIVIGVLTGLEIPLMIELKSQGDEEAASGVLGIDYLGAFLGTVLFAFLFYPRLGLIPTAFAVAGLNALVGALLFGFRHRVGQEDQRLHRRLLAVQAVLLGAAAVGFAFSAEISEFGIGLYLKTQ